MEKIGNEIKIINLNSKKDSSKGRKIIVSNGSKKKVYLAQSVATHGTYYPDDREDWLYAAKDMDGNSIFFLEQTRDENKKNIYLLDEAQNAEEYKFTSEGFFYYKKNEQWYVLGTKDSPLGKEILPNFFAKKEADNSYTITHNADNGYGTFTCKSYALGMDEEHGCKVILFGDVTTSRQEFLIVFFNHRHYDYRGTAVIRINNKKYTFSKLGRYWHEIELKKPEELYQFKD